MSHLWLVGPFLCPLLSAAGCIDGASSCAGGHDELSLLQVENVVKLGLKRLSAEPGPEAESPDQAAEEKKQLQEAIEQKTKQVEDEKAKVDALKAELARKKSEDGVQDAKIAQEKAKVNSLKAQLQLEGMKAKKKMKKIAKQKAEFEAKAAKLDEKEKKLESEANAQLKEIDAKRSTIKKIAERVAEEKKNSLHQKNKGKQLVAKEKDKGNKLKEEKARDAAKINQLEDRLYRLTDKLLENKKETTVQDSNAGIAPQRRSYQGPPKEGNCIEHYRSKEMQISIANKGLREYENAIAQESQGNNMFDCGNRLSRQGRATTCLIDAQCKSLCDECRSEGGGR